MTRDEAIEAGARALWDIDWPDRTGTVGVPEFYRRLTAAVLDAIGWAEPVGFLAAEPGALITSYPTFDQAARSGFASSVYAVVPVEGAIEPGTNSEEGR